MSKSKPAPSMSVESWPLAKITPYDKNPRKNDHAVDAVARSIEQYGFRQPIVVDAHGVVIVGHTRLKAAIKLGLAEAPVHVARDLSPEKVAALRIADNKTNEIAEWDMDLLGQEIRSLGDLSNIELGFTSMSELATVAAHGVAVGNVDPDEIPLPPDVPKTVRGDIYQLGDHRLMCGDSSSVSDLDRLLGGQSIHLVNTDPPYNVKVESRSNRSIASGGSSFKGTPNGRKAEKMRAKDRPLANDFVSDQEFDRLLAAWFGNIARVLIPGGGFYIWGGYSNCGNYPPVMRSCELKFAQAIIWVKEHPVMSRKDFMGNHEWCFYGWKEGAAHRFFGPKNVPDVWRVSGGSPVGSDRVSVSGDGVVAIQSPNGSTIVLSCGVPPKGSTVRDLGNGVDVAVVSGGSDVWTVKKVNQSKMVHLTEKPVELAARAMRFSSRRGENVLDLFGGSGSTMIAAEMESRRSFSMEIDPAYCDVIVSRWETFTGRKAKLIRVK